MSDTATTPGAQLRRFLALEDILMGFSDGIDGARLQAGLMWAKNGDSNWHRKDLINLFASPWTAAQEEAAWDGDAIAEGEKDLAEVTAAALSMEVPAIAVGATLRHQDGRTGAFACIEEDGRYRVQSLKGKGFWVFHPDDCEQIERLAPAPSSLAGGEDEIALIVAQACLDYASDTPSKFSERTVALGEITKSAVHRILAALSPEAPARETEDDLNDLAKEAHDEGYLNGFADAKWDRDQVYDRAVLTEDMDRDCLRDSWYEGLSSDFRSRIAAALTPCHEAPAEKAEYVDAVGALSVRTPEAREGEA